MIDPGARPGPSDAIVLFDGKDMSPMGKGDQWIVRDGWSPPATTIRTKQAFGDCQLHVEWAEPDKVVGSGQGRGNSGVFLMGSYEIQVLDSYQNETYYDGQCGVDLQAHPPLVNACRKPGQWQTYDIVFHAPRFDAQGKLVKPAYVTVLQNGVLVQNHFELLGRHVLRPAAAYAAHPDKLPIELSTTATRSGSATSGSASCRRK